MIKFLSLPNLNRSVTVKIDAAYIIKTLVKINTPAAALTALICLDGSFFFCIWLAST